jgi:hypothetical protein
MCAIDVSMFECGDYSLQVQGQPCSNAISRGPCSQPDVKSIIPRDRSCVRCIYVRSLETLIAINESMLRWEKKCATEATTSLIRIAREGILSPAAIEDHERTIQDMKAKLEDLRVAQRLPLLFTEGTDLSRRSQMLAIMKFQAKEMRSVLLADED